MPRRRWRFDWPPVYRQSDGLVLEAGWRYKRRWHFRGKDGGRYDVAIVGRSLMGALVYRRRKVFEVPVRIGFREVIGERVQLHGQDGFLDLEGAIQEGRRPFRCLEDSEEVVRRFVEQRQQRLSTGGE